VGVLVGRGVFVIVGVGVTEGVRVGLGVTVRVRVGFGVSPGKGVSSSAWLMTTPLVPRGVGVGIERGTPGTVLKSQAETEKPGSAITASARTKRRKPEYCLTERREVLELILRKNITYRSLLCQSRKTRMWHYPLVGCLLAAPRHGTIKRPPV
jgi:hypothetical protein